MTQMLFQAGEAMEMAAISKDQLREWTARRGILAPDIPSRGRGKHALYSWGTVLVLRLVADAHRRFHFEVAYWANIAPRLRAELNDQSFISLYGRVVAIEDSESYRLLSARSALPNQALLLIPLDAHLSALAESLGMATGPTQLPLFPAVSA